MKYILGIMTLFLSVLFSLQAAAERPSYEEMKKALRKQHPRLFITADQLPAFRARANGICKEYLLEMQKRVDALPDQPVFEIKNPAAHAGANHQQLVFFAQLFQNRPVHGIQQGFMLGQRPVQIECDQLHRGPFQMG